MGRRDKPERNDWFDHECCLVMEKKNKAYKKLIQGRFTQTAEKEYKETCKEEKKIHRKKKREYYNNKLTELEQLHTAKESRKFF